VRSLMIGFAAGLAGWTLLEYAIHYWLGHLPKGRTLISSEHLAHHRDILYFTPLARKVRGAVPVLGLLLAVAGLTVGLPAGVGVVGAVAVGWTAYEWLHQSIHVAGPRNGYERWAARRHLHHHFVQPNRNHGVTTPLWDWVFGTYTPVTRVRVPSRALASLPWLRAAHDAVASAPGFVADYEIT